MKMFLPRRLRRNRRHPVLRSLCAESQLSVSDLVFPLFVQDRSPRPEEIASMPGILRHSESSLLREVERCLELGLKAFALFPLIEESKKDARASEALRQDGLYARALYELRRSFPEALLISDVALDPYSSEGHDGLVDPDGRVLNDETLPLLGDMALLHAQLGVDVVAPSDMMDGRVAYIRNRLDEAGQIETAILSYTAKYASALYGPFREALGSAPKLGDKKSYQMDPSNTKEALEEANQDHTEGADMLMVKPAGMYLDVIHSLSLHHNIPIAAYQVSGEYAMIKSAAAAGYLEEKTMIEESLLSIRRAGARFTFTYFAKQVAEARQ